MSDLILKDSNTLLLTDNNDLAGSTNCCCGCVFKYVSNDPSKGKVEGSSELVRRVKEGETSWWVEAKVTRTSSTFLTGYKFVGWYDETGYLINTDVPNKYSVDSDSDTGTYREPNWLFLYCNDEMKGYHVYTARFEDQDCEITFSATTGGTVTNAGKNVLTNGSVTSTATANSGYTFVGWKTEDDPSYSIISTDNPLTEYCDPYDYPWDRVRTRIAIFRIGCIVKIETDGYEQVSRCFDTTGYDCEALQASYFVETGTSIIFRMSQLDNNRIFDGWYIGDTRVGTGTYYTYTCNCTTSKTVVIKLKTVKKCCCSVNGSYSTCGTNVRPGSNALNTHCGRCTDNITFTVTANSCADGPKWTLYDGSTYYGSSVTTTYAQCPKSWAVFKGTCSCGSGPGGGNKCLSGMCGYRSAFDYTACDGSTAHMDCQSSSGVCWYCFLGKGNKDTCEF